LASRREERVQKAFSVDHHGPGDARLSHSAAGINIWRVRDAFFYQ
jgi:hypothetical protein